MDAERFSYLLFELSSLSLALLILFPLGYLRTVTTRRFLILLAALYVSWISWDLLAVRHGVFHFPSAGSLPWRIAGLPLEEHLFFPIHTLNCWAAIAIADMHNPKKSQRPDEQLPLL